MTTQARAKLFARGTADDVSSMDTEKMWAWVDRLPRDEFFALLDANDELLREGKVEEPPPPNAPVPALPPDDDAWLTYVGEGEPPLPGDAQCYVLFPDGTVLGPNRADSFLWGDAGSAAILAYQSASLVS